MRIRFVGGVWYWPDYAGLAGWYDRTPVEAKSTVIMLLNREQLAAGEAKRLMTWIDSCAAGIASAETEIERG